MKKTLQESMRNLHRFQLDFSLILGAFSAYFGSQKTSKINENSVKGLQRPLGASGVAFGRPFKPNWSLWRPKLSQKTLGLAECAGALSQSRSRQSSTCAFSHALLPPKKGGGSSPGPPRIPPGRPKSPVGWPSLASKIASKFSLDF